MMRSVRSTAARLAAVPVASLASQTQQVERCLEFGRLHSLRGDVALVRVRRLVTDLISWREHEGFMRHGQRDALRARERAQGSRVPGLDGAKTLSVVFQAHQVNASPKCVFEEACIGIASVLADVDMVTYSASHVDVAVDP